MVTAKDDMTIPARSGDVVVKKGDALPSDTPATIISALMDAGLIADTDTAQKTTDSVGKESQA